MFRRPRTPCGRVNRGGDDAFPGSVDWFACPDSKVAFVLAGGVSSARMIRAIAADNFPPFGKFRMEFPPVEIKPDDLGEVHLITGVYGTGKTRVLSVLAAILDYPEPLKTRLKGLESSIKLHASDRFPLHEITKWGHFQADAHNFNQDHNSHYNDGILQWRSILPAFAYSGVAYIADAPVAVMGDLPRPSRGTCRPARKTHKLCLLRRI